MYKCITNFVNNKKNKKNWKLIRIVSKINNCDAKKIFNFRTVTYA